MEIQRKNDRRTGTVDHGFEAVEPIDPARVLTIRRHGVTSFWISRTARLPPMTSSGRTQRVQLMADYSEHSHFKKKETISPRRMMDRLS
jgi:1,2-phenylacetyl-CoA epoxidase PaaB subunit